MTMSTDPKTSTTPIEQRAASSIVCPIGLSKITFSSAPQASANPKDDHEPKTNLLSRSGASINCPIGMSKIVFSAQEKISNENPQQSTDLGDAAFSKDCLIGQSKVLVSNT